MKCHCPNCSTLIPPTLVAEWVASVSKTRLSKCEGIREDGTSCDHLLKARERMRPCSACGFTNWKAVQRDAAAAKGQV